jgi:ElaB/YqjD/DUF883 family membrane-anchored ribosome-binding protein
MAGSRFQDISDEAREISAEALHRLGDGASYVRERGRKVIDASGRVIGELAEEAGARGRRAARYAVREARAHPLSTLAIGVAVGGLVTYLLLRDRD